MKSTITHQPVKSSAVESAGYEPVSRTMEVRYRGDGSLYRYLDVPAAVHAAFMASPSKGKFLNQSIHGKYKSQPVK